MRRNRSGGDCRINNDESLTVTIRYRDPNHSLVSLKLKEIGVFWGDGEKESTVFTDSRNNSFNVAHIENEAKINYVTTGLAALTKDNTGTWFLTVRADDSRGKTTTGLGAFVLEYEVDPESARTDSDSPIGFIS